MKQILKQALTVVCSVFIVAYTIMQLSFSAGDDYETEHAFYSVVNDTLTATAYIFRDETVVMQNGGGTRCYSVKNGEKVHTGEELCVTYRTSDEAGVQETINSLNRQIDLLKKSSISSGAFSTDLSRINSGINEYLLEIQRFVAAGDLAAAARLRDDLLVQMNRRQAIVSDSADPFGSQISELTQRKTALESSLSGVKASTTASQPGYFYTGADGYEKIFSVSALSSVTPESFKAIISSEPDGNVLANAVGKIAGSSKWYIAFVATRREAAYFEKDGKYGVIFSYAEDREISMTYEGAGGDTPDGDVVLVFGTNILPDEFSFTRRQEVKVIKSTMQGLKIRTSALVNVDGETGVYSLSSGRVVFKTAEVLCENGGFYLVRLPNEQNRSERSATKLSLHDTVLTGGKNLYVGKVLS